MPWWAFDFCSYSIRRGWTLLVGLDCGVISQRRRDSAAAGKTGREANDGPRTYTFNVHKMASSCIPA